MRKRHIFSYVSFKRDQNLTFENVKLCKPPGDGIYSLFLSSLGHQLASKGRSLPAANNQNSDNQQLNSFIDDAILGVINTHFRAGSISH